MTEEDASSSGRILLKLSGEVMAGPAGHGVDPSTVRGIADALVRLTEMGFSPGVVTGGGNFVRGSRLQGIDRDTGDQMGMLATVINGLALRESILSLDGKAVVLSALPVTGVVRVFSPGSAREYLQRGFIAIYTGGTGNTRLTTDTAAALRAVQTNCSRLLKGTKVDGIYDRDPAVHSDAKRFSSISFDDVLKRDLRVMDAAAVAICRDAGLPISVFDIREPENIVNVCRDPAVGSMIGGD